MLLKKEASKSQSPSSLCCNYCFFVWFFFFFMLQKLWRENERKITPTNVSLHSETLVSWSVFDGHFRTSICGAKQRHSCNLLPFILGSSTIITLQTLRNTGGDNARRRNRPIYSETPPHHLVMPVQLENNAKTNKQKAILMQSCKR